MQNGMMFGGEGPIMQGTWYNPNTGDAFTVRDSFFEDNQYVVVATDGRVFRYEQLKNYLQTDMKLEDLKKIKKEEPIPDAVKNLIEDNDDSYKDLLLPEDNIILSEKNLGNIYNNMKSDTNERYLKQDFANVDFHDSKTNVSSMSMNYMIIEKALKNTNCPKISISLNWNDYPEKQIDMLKDIMEISEDEIVEWYLKNISMLDIVEEFKESIKNKIRCHKSTPDKKIDKTIKPEKIDKNLDVSDKSETKVQKKIKK